MLQPPKHDVCRDPLSPAMRRWVDAAAAVVVAEVKGYIKPYDPAAGYRPRGASDNNGLTPLARDALGWMNKGLSDGEVVAKVGMSAGYVRQLRERFIVERRLNHMGRPWNGV